MSHEADGVLGHVLVQRIIDWLTTREALLAKESAGDYPAPGRWHDNDDDAAYILSHIAALFEIEAEEVK